MSNTNNTLTRRELLTGRWSEPVKPADSGRFVGPASSTPGGVSTSERASRRLPDCVVRNHREDTFRLVSDLISDQRVILGFIYTRCKGICPTTTLHMREAYRVLTARQAAPFRMITISVDPERDSPDDLLRHAAVNDVAGFPNWQFVVASPEDTLAIRRGLRLVDPDPVRDRNVSTHSGVLVLGNDRSNRWGGIPSGAAPVHIANTFERIARVGTLQEFAGFGQQPS